MEHHSAPHSYTANQKPHNKDGLKSIISTILIFVLAPLVALLLTTFVFHSYQVDGPSMETTLQHGDRLIVSKIPRTWSKITGNAFIPERGEIIVFHRQTEGTDKQLIKRVIALPGERVVVSAGVLTVFNDEHPDGYRPDSELPSGEVVTTTPGDVDLTVPENAVFVAGDNRENSLDSRNFGAVQAKDIVGQLRFRVFPFNKSEKF